MPELDASAEESRQIPYELPKVDAILSREIDREFLAVPLPLRVRDLHWESVFLDPFPHLSTDVFFSSTQFIRQLNIRLGCDAENGPGRFRFLVRATGGATDFTLPFCYGPERRYATEVLATLDGYDDGLTYGKAVRCLCGEKALTVPLEPDFDELGGLSAQ